MRHFIIGLCILLLSVPAHAHSMRAFAKVDANQISGYAFFIGGGRPSGVDWFAKMDNQVIAKGKTGTDGSYAFAVPDNVTGDISITVDTREGHVATTQIAQQRLGQDVSSPVENGTATDRQPDNNKSINTAIDNKQLRQEIEEAVEHQIGPLLERIEEMDSRMRLTDTLSGIFLIIGLAGIGLWASSRKK